MKIGETILPSEQNPKYLGVTLDRQLSYRKHLEGCANKIGKRNCLLRKLTGTSWGASQTVLRTSTLALCYSVAEYCAPVWTRSSHTNKVDVKLRESMRLVSGCLKSTPTQWLPTLSSLTPPHIRREVANQRMIKKIKDMPKHIPLKQIVESAPTTTRLRSRRPFYKSELEDFNPIESWRSEWANNTPTGGNLIGDPTQPVPGFGVQTRKHWVVSNRLLSRHGRTAANMHKWGLKDSQICPRCNGAPETSDHIVLHCRVTKLDGGYQTILNAGENLTNWIDQHKLEV